MKNLFLAGALALAGTASAQSLNFGVTAGADVDIARTDYKNPKSTQYYKSEVGGFAGLFLEYRENKYFRVQAGANYLFNKDVFDKKSDGAIQLPLTFKFYVLADKLNIQVGPRLAYSFNKLDEEFNPVRFSLAGGLGYEINKHFFVDANYLYQLNDGINQYYDDSVNQKINFVQVGLGYRF